MPVITLAPFSRYHQRVMAIAIYNSKPKSNDRDLMDAWVRMSSEIGAAIREQGGQFNMEAWLDTCFYGPK
jgi:hypothetical protein